MPLQRVKNFLLQTLSKSEPLVSDDRRVRIPMLGHCSDEDLETLNNLLPWASYLVDENGRQFGRPYAAKKRAQPQQIPDPRIVELDRRLPLKNCRVLELGCFEGHHTVALAERAREVIAIDSRIENVVKTIVRCAMFRQRPSVELVDLEAPIPDDISIECDVLHHIGVLYHLTDPVAHLEAFLASTRQMIMLDTHVARDTDTLKTYERGGRTYHYSRLREGGRDAPFAGMRDHAKWLLEPELVGLLQRCGFANVDVAERRNERNGLRVLIYASR